MRAPKRYLLLFVILLGICGVIYWRHNATKDVTELPKYMCTLKKDTLYMRYVHIISALMFACSDFNTIVQDSSWQHTYSSPKWTWHDLLRKKPAGPTAC